MRELDREIKQFVNLNQSTVLSDINNAFEGKKENVQADPNHE